MNIPISNRLLACCGFVRPGDRAADVGTDHGYLGIYLLKNGIASHVIAADLNEQPLHNAWSNARRYGVQEQMTFCLSDGFQKLPREFDVGVCAGMGADTMISILRGAPWLAQGEYRLIFQCQSQRHALRRMLPELGWHITREILAKDGKFIYTIMELMPGGEAVTPGQCYISKPLLEAGGPLLPDFYDRILGNLRRTVQGLEKACNHRDHDNLDFYRQALAELEGWEEAIHGNGQ